VKNVVEDLVRTLYTELLPRVPDAHDCPQCREDVCVYALNRIPPHYVASLKGEVLSKLDLEVGQSRTDATVVLMEGLRYVAANPRCGRRTA